ncbi:MAG: DEAD/DEAH box helicase [Candidatus Hadarchaeia archaeon]
MDEFKKLKEEVKNSLKDFGIRKPTLIQRNAIEPVLNGKNALLIAPTGTGKTEAALLPVLSQFLEQKREGIRILYVAPLRALNRDISKRLQKWEDILDIEIGVRHGDTEKRERRKQAQNPPDMLITTPETLQAILPGKRMKEHLKSVKWVVVDEVHELAESKRGTQLTLGLERLKRYSGKFQRIGLSATIGNEKEVANFLSGTASNTEVITAVSENEMSIEVEAPLPNDDDISISDEINADPSTMARLRRIKELLEEHGSTLIFVNTRKTAENLGSRLRMWDEELSMSVHHGSLSKNFRVDSEDEFRTGDLEALIATSSMELGIDIGAIDFVVQHRSPRQVKRMIQRVGRSGHGVSRESKGVIISTDPDDALEAISLSRKTLAGEIESTRVFTKSLDVLSHQIVGMNLDGLRKADDIFQLIKDAYPYRNLTREEFHKVLEQLQNEGLLWRGNEGIGRSSRTWKYYYTNLSMIVDIKKFDILDIYSGKSIGSLDEEFVVGHIEPGSTFICKGESWRVVEVESDQVRVEPTEDPYGAIPAWEGELIPVSSSLALEVGELRGLIRKYLMEDRDKKWIAQTLESEYPSNEGTMEWIVNLLDKQAESVGLPTDKEMIIEIYRKFAILHAPFGTRVNRTLAEILSALISTRIGESVRFRSDSYRIAFKFPSARDAKKVEDALRDLEPEFVEPILKKILTETSVFMWRLLHVAKRFGAIDQDADFSEISRKYLKTFKDTPLWVEAQQEILHEKMEADGLKRQLERFKDGELNLVVKSTNEPNGPSPMGLSILNELARSGEIAMPKRAERKILETLERRLKNRQVRLYCLNCLNWSTVTRVRRLEDKPECKKCGARLLGLVYTNDAGIRGIMKKRSNNESLDSEERKKAERVKKSADLILTHGKKAILAMAARGIGPETASRILRIQHKDKVDYLKAIHKAERQYARTRRFWD